MKPCVLLLCASAAAVHVAAAQTYPTKPIRFVKDGADAIGSTPTAFTELIGTETKRWAEVVRVSGARID